MVGEGGPEDLSGRHPVAAPIGIDLAAHEIPKHQLDQLGRLLEDAIDLAKLVGPSMVDVGGIHLGGVCLSGSHGGLLGRGVPMSGAHRRNTVAETSISFQAPYPI